MIEAFLSGAVMGSVIASFIIGSVYIIFNWEK